LTVDVAAQKTIARAVLAEIKRRFRDPPFGSGRLVEMATAEAKRLDHPNLAGDADFLVWVACRRLERDWGVRFDWEGLPTWDSVETDGDRKLREMRALNAKRKRIAVDVLRRFPNGGSVRMTPGRLASDAAERARTLGRPEMAGDRGLMTAVAKDVFAGQLGAGVLDFT
jgi:hypothetical protein